MLTFKLHHFIIAASTNNLALALSSSFGYTISKAAIAPSIYQNSWPILSTFSIISSSGVPCFFFDSSTILSSSVISDAYVKILRQLTPL
jgi:hypothetical protein